MPITRSMTRKRIKKGLSTGLRGPLQKHNNKKTKKITTPRKKRKTITPKQNNNYIKRVSESSEDDNWDFLEIPNTTSDMTYNIDNNYFSQKKGKPLGYRKTQPPKSIKKRHRSRLGRLHSFFFTRKNRRNNN